MDTKAIHYNQENRVFTGSARVEPRRGRINGVFALGMILLVLLLLTSGCGRMQAAQPAANTTGYTLSLVAQPDPPVMGHAQLLIGLADPSGKPVDGAQVHVEGNMTHAGMVPVLADSKGSQDGRYAVPFNWTMDGDWVVTVKATLPDGLTVARDFPVRVGK